MNWNPSRDHLDIESDRLKARMAQICSLRGSALPNAALQLALMFPLDGKRSPSAATGPRTYALPRNAKLYPEIVASIDLYERSRAAR
jgi:hypothetical protein